QVWRHRNADRFCCVQSDDEFELGRLQDRQIGRLGAFEDAAGINAGLAMRVGEFCSVAHQAASFGIGAQGIDRWHSVARSQRGELYRRLMKRLSGWTKSASARLCTRLAKAVSISTPVLAVKNSICGPMAAASTSFLRDSAV